jgi:hypothetical protein
MAFGNRLIKINDEGGEGLGFNTVVYSGNGTGQSIDTVGFAPDLVWVKNRFTTNYHILSDTVRGANKQLYSNTADYEQPDAGFITGFNIDGFDVGSSASTNTSGTDNYVAWCWKGGDSTVTNTDGTITSQVSANAGAGFSIVTWTGLGTSDNDTNGGNFWRIGHGLNDAPKMIIVKCRTYAHGWHVGHDDLSGWTSGWHLVLNSNAAEATPNPIYNVQRLWGNAVPSTTTFGVGGWDIVNRVGDDYIAYCFAEVAGFSKFGSYTGTGNTNGEIVSTGFEVAFLLVKKATGSADDWFIFDNKRTPVGEAYIRPNSSSAELDYGGDFMRIDATDGFQPIWGSPAINASGETYIYMAFANQF